MDDLFTVYEVRQLQDLTEGRGPMVTRGYYPNESDAFDFLESIYGVQGTTSGKEIVKVIYKEPEPGFTHFGREEIRVWGYRRGPDKKSSLGWTDFRDIPENDPEYEEYLRLHKKFNP